MVFTYQEIQDNFCSEAWMESGIEFGIQRRLGGESTEVLLQQPTLLTALGGMYHRITQHGRACSHVLDSDWPVGATEQQTGSWGSKKIGDLYSSLKHYVSNYAGCSQYHRHQGTCFKGVWGKSGCRLNMGMAVLKKNKSCFTQRQGRSYNQRQGNLRGGK